MPRSILPLLLPLLLLLLLLLLLPLLLLLLLLLLLSLLLSLLGLNKQIPSPGFFVDVLLSAVVAAGGKVDVCERDRMLQVEDLVI